MVLRWIWNEQDQGYESERVKKDHDGNRENVFHKKLQIRYCRRMVRIHTRLQ